MDHSADNSALEKIIGDMDDMESNRVYGDKPTPAGGVSITIDVAPKKAEDKKEEPLDAEPEPEDESGMPPFLRKRS